ncbi:hypothetical protein [Roseivirga pacifica]|uniref:hypothetical protein n=1 Tax=Roseivirga pacifica TaxID=1267423 RepID=UPI0020962D8D|nr:hypothetical protein [Roseivirga pacifica]MCO6357328.1 hypothetical protein [Roseivirga pacifica]MCO6367958.1 hypothetical protein [Roseivirga pacifica]MCO6369560.1 hypothetical protein [Roseivirga pacifica]MCO6373414.1 hypothetical protein [Roseivirga pacifica]MCO6377329.1 hypothetical protein [Roseivirga pacifica]
MNQKELSLEAIDLKATQSIYFYPKGNALFGLKGETSAIIIVLNDDRTGSKQFESIQRLENNPSLKVEDTQINAYISKLLSENKKVYAAGKSVLIRGKRVLKLLENNKIDYIQYSPNETYPLAIYKSK